MLNTVDRVAIPPNLRLSTKHFVLKLAKFSNFKNTTNDLAENVQASALFSGESLQIA